MVKIINEIRQLVAVLILAVAAVAFFIPSAIAVLAFVIASAICGLVVAIGGVLGAICFVPVVFITPGGISSIRKAVAEETK